MGSQSAAALVVVGDPVGAASDSDASILRGHGTLPAEDGQLRATLCGSIHRVNRLLSVQSLKSRYTAETGDVVIGRVLQVAARRWRVDVGSVLSASLMLSAVTLPGDVQRRRTGSDEQNMRSIFQEADLISAEVQNRQSDGSALLHTRSNKYGKLSNGMLVQVAPYLVKRMKHHFHFLFPNDPSRPVLLILGCNGFIWVGLSSMSLEDSSKPALALVDGDANKKKSDQVTITREVRECICRVGAVVKALAKVGLPIDPSAIKEKYEESLQLKLSIVEVLSEKFLTKIST